MVPKGHFGVLDEIAIDRERRVAANFGALNVGIDRARKGRIEACARRDRIGVFQLAHGSAPK